MSGHLKRAIKKAIDLPLSAVGLELRRAESQDFSQDHFNPRLHQDAASLPAGASEYLRADNPRLLELHRRYDTLGWPVCVHSRWMTELVDQWLNLMYFRGESVYVWHYRQGEELSKLRFHTFLRYLLERDDRGLLSLLGEDGAFGCWTYSFPGLPLCSRDLLDSVNELLFLDRTLGVFELSDLRVLDIGAGYGRLAHRACTALPTIGSYTCVDAVPESTFLSEYYLRYRNVAAARVAEIAHVPDFEPGQFDLAVNIHSFSECPRAAIEWWMAQLARLQVPRLLVVPNEPEGFLSMEPDQVQRHDYLAIIEDHGYHLKVDEPVLDDPAVRDVLGIGDRFCLFERQQ